MPGELEDALAQERARRVAASQKREQARARGEAIVAEFLEKMASRPSDLETVRTPTYAMKTERIGVFRSKQVTVKTGETVVEHDLGGWVLQERTGAGKDSPGRPLIVLSREGQVLNEGRAVTPDYSLDTPSGSTIFASKADRVFLRADGLYTFDLILKLQNILHTHGLQ